MLPVACIRFGWPGRARAHRKAATTPAFWCSSHAIEKWSTFVEASHTHLFIQLTRTSLSPDSDLGPQSRQTIMIDEDQGMSNGRRSPGPSLRRNHISMASGTTVHLAINAFHAQVERNRTLELGDSSPSASRRLSRGSSTRRSIGRIARLAAISSATGGEPGQVPIGETSELLDNTVDIALLPPKNLLSRKSGCLPVPSEIIQSMINASPGTYQLDDGSPDISDLYNFYAHGKRFLVGHASIVWASWLVLTMCLVVCVQLLGILQ